MSASSVNAPRRPAGGVPDRLAFLSRPEAIWVLVGALTAAAFALRLPHIHETLILDEHYAYDETHVGSLSEVIERVHNGGENSPPLYFVLAWAAMKLGDPTVLIRLPSLVLSTLTVPIVYLLGARTVGKPAGLIGAALFAFSPFAIFYASEARPYATMVFLATSSTLLLLIALERGGWQRWALFSVAACGVLYAHYFGVFALIAQGCWAIWAYRDRLREIVLAYVAVGIGFVPWLIAWRTQNGNSITQLASYWPLNVKDVGRELLRLTIGDPNVRPTDLPGRAWIVLAVLAVLAALAAALVRRAGRIPRPEPPIILLLLLAIVPVIGFLVYSKLGPGIVIARYMIPALPALLLLAGAALAAAPRPVALVATAVVLAAFASGAFASLDAENRRPAWREAAHYIDDNARPGDLVVEANCDPEERKDCARWGRVPGLEVSFEKPHKLSLTAPAVFRDPPPRNRIFVTGITVGFLQAPRPAPDAGLCLLGRKVFDGQTPVSVNEYASARHGGTLEQGGAVIALPSGDIPVVPGAAQGSLESVTKAADSLSVTAWAVGASRAPAGCVLVFSDGRLVGTTPATVERPDVAKTLGIGALGSGFKLDVLGHRADPSKVRVFAVADGKASELAPA